MKKVRIIFALALAVIMVFSFTACLEDTGENKDIVSNNGGTSNQGGDNGGSTESEQDVTIQETVCFEYRVKTTVSESAKRSSSNLAYPTISRSKKRTIMSRSSLRLVRRKT